MTTLALLESKARSQCNLKSLETVGNRKGRDTSAMDGIVTNISAKAAAEAWLRDFGAALASGEIDRVAALFADDCHWRDILAFTWDLRTTSRAASIAQRMASALSQTAPRAVALAPGRTVPRHVIRAGVDTIEVIFVFSKVLALQIKARELGITT